MNLSDICDLMGYSPDRLRSALLKFINVLRVDASDPSLLLLVVLGLLVVPTLCHKEAIQGGIRCFIHIALAQFNHLHVYLLSTVATCNGRSLKLEG